MKNDSTTLLWGYPEELFFDSRRLYNNVNYFVSVNHFWLTYFDLKGTMDLIMESIITMYLVGIQCVTQAGSGNIVILINLKFKYNQNRLEIFSLVKRTLIF